MPHTLALIGYGYWGPVLLRNFAANPAFAVKYICDRHPERAADAAKHAPAANFITDPAQLFADPALDIIVIATQAASHATLIRQSLTAGKHVFVEKPFTLDLAEAEQLTALAQSGNRVLWIDHTFLFNPAYAALKTHLAANAIGKLRRFHSTRTSFGQFQTDADIFWHLAYHDAYLLNDLFPALPAAVTAATSAHVTPGIADAAIVSLTYAGGMQATLLTDMNFPEKKREIILSGETGSIVWDEMRPDTLRLFHHKAVPDAAKRRINHEFPGNAEILSVAKVEALTIETAAFADFLNGKGASPCDAQKALQTLRLIGMMQTASQPKS